MIHYLQELDRILNRYNISKNDVCLITSASLACRGIRSNNDIEFALKSDVREALLKTKEIEFEYNTYSGVIKFTKKIECVFQLYRIFGINDDELFEDDKSEIVQGYRVVRLELYAALKRIQNREKDLKDIKALRETSFWNEKLEKSINKYVGEAIRYGMEIPSVNIQELWESIFATDNSIYVFGMGYIGKNIHRRILRDGFEKKLRGFIVSSNDSCSEYEGIPVFDIESINDKDNCIIIVAVAIQTMVDNMEMLKGRGFTNLISGFQFWS